MRHPSSVAAIGRAECPNQRGAAVAPVMLIVGFVLFVGVLGYMLWSSMTPRTTTAYDPTPIMPLEASVDTLVYDTVTIDAVEPAEWTFFDFDRLSVVLPPDTQGWDLAVRRFAVVPAAAAADLGAIGFDDIAEVTDSGFVPTTFARDTVNAAIDRWYRYSMVSHILEPIGHVYAIRTREGRYAKMEILSYYCPGIVAGCLTFRYVYQPSGERTFE